MQYERYETRSSAPFLQYDFYSEGPRGRIEKRVVFRQFEWNPDVFNLTLGDVDDSGNLNDRIITNNKDTEKVLATVASAIWSFFEHHPEKSVFVSANSPARLRLYRIAISINLRQLERSFLLFGLIGRNWRSFNPGTNYNAFLVQSKKVSL